MALRIIYGKSGAGKSEFIFKEIEKQKEKNKIYIITPEQFSFTAEKKLMENRTSIINAEVITFNRMAYRVKNEVGGGIYTNLSKCGKSMLIYWVLQNEKNNLKLLNKTDENIDLAMRTISEFKKNGITINDLKENIDKIQDNYLKIKLQDMILVYEKFSEKLKNKYIDETDLLTELANNIDQVDLFKDAYFYIDEFVGFTKQELEIIKKLLKIAKMVNITFCIDNLDLNTNPDLDVFYPNKVTLNKILKLLDKDEKIETINLDKLYRFKNNELLFMEKNLYNSISKYEEKVDNIELFLSNNKYTEVEYVAKNIINLIKKKEYKFSDIAVISKNINSYSSLFKSIFSKYEIPVFIDEKKDLNQNILIRYVLGLLEIIIKNYSYESIFNYLKLDILEVDEEDVFKLEKYCLKYGIKNNKFKKEFLYGITEQTKNEVEYLNKLREKLILPIVDLESKINKKQDIQNIVKEVYQFLINQNIEQRLKNKINKFEENNLLELVNEYKISYDVIIKIFDEIIDIFNGEKVTLSNFEKIFKIGLKNSGIGKIPSSQDEVIVGDTDRSRSHKVKAIFIIGLNDGVFPSVNRVEGFFNDKDRINLKENGIEIAKGTIENLYDDNFNIYKAFTTAEEKLFLSYCQTDTDGKSLRPSILLWKIKKIFPKLEEKSDVLEKQRYDFLVNEKNMYEEFVLSVNSYNEKEIDKNLGVQYKYFMQNEKYNSILRNSLNYIKNLKMPEKIKEENVFKLYGNNLKTSISKLESFKSCPYEYFLQYSLKLKQNQELKVKNLDTGSFMHEVINSFFETISNENLDVKNIDDETQEKIVNKIIDEKLQESKNYIFVASEKYKLLVRRLKRIILKALKYIILSLKTSDFTIQGTEIAFDEKNGKYKPIIINLENGKKIEIVGKIDRIDIAKDENNNYVRIIDYKSSVKDIDFTNVYAGLQLQLITYLDAVCKIEDFIPAGILYFNLIEQMINSDVKLTQEEIEEKIKNNFKMKGLILADVKVAKMQDNTLSTSGTSKIIPAYITKEGELSPKKSSIATKEEFQKLQKYVNNTIKEIGKEILNGNIKLKPYYKDGKTPCEYCDYKKICGFDSGLYKTGYNFINKKTKEDIYNAI